MFQLFDICSGKLVDRSAGAFPYSVIGFCGSSLILPTEQTHFGMILSGTARLTDSFGHCLLRAGMFFSVSEGELEPLTENAKGLIITCPGYKGYRQFGGPVETVGRLRYINGCSDTLLICPPILGEPCLNHLHIPRNTAQHTHFHPTDRVGVILDGKGVCSTEDGEYELKAGQGWFIPFGCRHSYRTSDQKMDVLAWHPDSDFGPTDENHPMINRTLREIA